MKIGFAYARARAAAVLLLWAGAMPAAAQESPPDTSRAPAALDPIKMEVLVKTSLMSLNDANLTGNYAVFHARANFMVSAERVSEAFARFRNAKDNIDYIVALKPVYTEGPSVIGRDLLRMKGHFDSRPSRVTFDLAYVRSGEQWRLVRILVNIVPAPNQ